MIEWTMEQVRPLFIFLRYTDLSSQDQLLLRAYDIASIEIAYEIERLRAWRFRKTADWMRRMDKTSLFSGKACHARYSALLDGTATIPCDVDDDPAARQAAMASFRATKEASRDAAREADDAQATQKERIRLEAATRQAALSLEKAAKQVAKSQAANARATERATKKTLQARNAEEHLRKKEVAAREKAEKQARAEEAFKLRQDFALSHFRDVDEQTPDPRRVLDVADLCTLCRARGLNDHVSRREGEAKGVLLGRLRDADWSLRVPALREMVKVKGLPTGGNKAQMVHQLALFAARGCASWVEGDDGEMEVEADGHA